MFRLLSFYLVVSVFYSCINEKAVNHNLSNIEEKKTDTRQIEVLTLGTFHFNFPNLDVVKTDEENQIDVLEPVHQKEIELIVEKLMKFKPTKIVIERQPEKQQLFDSLYKSYLKGEHILNRSEEQQIGFRLAQKMGLSKLYCVDAWGQNFEDIKVVVDGVDAIAKDKFMDFFYNNPDSILTSYRNEKPLFKSHGILPELRRLNSDEFLKSGLGDYLIGIFKYETKENNQFGPDFVTSWWFNRNLRIFRNIQRIKTNNEDRILVIYGAGHMNLLNIFFDASPEYKLLTVNEYLN